MKTRTIATSGTLLAAVLAVSACTQSKTASTDFGVDEVQSVAYSAPAPISLRNGYDIVGGSSAKEAASNVASRLRAAGITDVRVSSNGSEVRASTGSPDSVDCGEVIVRGNSGSEMFSANARRAVVPVPGSAGEFVRREMGVNTRYDIRIAPVAGRPNTYAARVGGDHATTLVAYPLLGTRAIHAHEASFAYGSGAPVGNTECRSTPLVERIIWP